MRAVIALGGNLGDPQSTFNAAEREIEARVGPVVRSSMRYSTEPLLDPDNPVPDQPRYLNSALLVDSALSAADILRQLLEIELKLGRRRERKWGPRTIDLDLIACAEQVIDEPGLSVPHPEMHRRSFVLEPFVEIWPDWRHPLIGKTARELLADLVSTAAS